MRGFERMGGASDHHKTQEKGGECIVQSFGEIAPQRYSNDPREWEEKKHTCTFLDDGSPGKEKNDWIIAGVYYLITSLLL